MSTNKAVCAMTVAAIFCLGSPGGDRARADDVPFAQALFQLQNGPELLPTLGDIMSATQQRHIKLWFAGRSGNWPLAAYEIQQIKDSFDKAAILYVNIPVEMIVSLNGPLGDLRAAVQARSSKDFTASFGQITASCNTCHDAGQVGFIKIQTPTVSPFSNQTLTLPAR